MIGSEGARAGVAATSSLEGQEFKGASRRLARCAAALLAAWTAILPLAGAHAADPDRPTPSGLPVPRYVSLKFGEVNARAGPGDDSRLLWIYRVKGLPVQVVAENTEWRRICDPEHGLAWVHRRTTDGKRMVLRAAATPLTLRHKPKDDARIVAYMAGRSLGALDRCAKGWCRVKVGPADGWAKASELWGTDETPQCR